MSAPEEETLADQQYEEEFGDEEEEEFELTPEKDLTGGAAETPSPEQVAQPTYTYESPVVTEPQIEEYNNSGQVDAQGATPVEGYQQDAAYGYVQQTEVGYIQSDPNGGYTGGYMQQQDGYIQSADGSYVAGYVESGATAVDYGQPGYTPDIQPTHVFPPPEEYQAAHPTAEGDQQWIEASGGSTQYSNTAYTPPPSGAGQVSINMDAVSAAVPPSHPPPAQPASSSSAGPGFNIQQTLGSFFPAADFRQQVTQQVVTVAAEGAFSAAKQKASGFSQYMGIQWLVDWLQPYFGVDGSDVLRRLLTILMPREYQLVKSPDLYGPLMIVLTLSTLIIISMQFQGAQVGREGTVIGSALGLCFGYWFVVSIALLCAAMSADTKLGVAAVFSAVGYNMASFIVVLVLAAISHLVMDLSWLLFLVVGGAAAVGLGVTLKQATERLNAAWGMFLGGVACPMVFLFYLMVRYGF
eukprot:TRINITY_DN67617_c0_g1_i1.p1 TRINITY_DN67617_c0_g1~~TRINITY_DN67617_c0_g1_i1.p1  ORF type:complete len:467 (+),score=101.62 TRINITY_DN67617_c0_g1_i1:96-1496(+)